MRTSAFAFASFIGSALTAAIAIPENAEWYTIRTQAYASRQLIRDLMADRTASSDL
jgi:hypothetical protein